MHAHVLTCTHIQVPRDNDIVMIFDADMKARPDLARIIQAAAARVEALERHE